MEKDPLNNPALCSAIAERFKALSDSSRIRILALLRDADELNVSSIVTGTDINQASVSKHLSLLKQVGIVHVRREGNQAFYSIRDQKILDICGLVCEGITERMKEDNSALGL